ncbi:hypothetical protein CBOM_05867 [Ceraceosorus bombacis]|uniref:Uncharacterized protein n=1 Tax=Ceraceosorus bombacis TaxID=401625 RepID=A0A0P1BQP0_9BASI|nr:hypothetical protein CBOM_05867 [Ceraceosorus bombacis]
MSAHHDAHDYILANPESRRPHLISDMADGLLWKKSAGRMQNADPARSSAA